MFYATDMAKNQHKKWNTLARCLVAISQVHQESALESPTRHWIVRRFLSGLQRELGVAPSQKRPLDTVDLKRILKTLPDSLQGKRDGALLLLGFLSALRRSELVSLDAGDIRVTPEGIIIAIRRGKTDQEGKGREVGLPRGVEECTCPQRMLHRWLSTANIESGPVFRPITRHGSVLPTRLSPEAVAIIVKRHVARLGYDPDCYAGHSLRSGLATAAARAGKSERTIMRQTGHRSQASVRRYIREGSVFNDNAASGLGL